MQIPGFQMNSELAQTLTLAVETGRLPHAVILEGGSAVQRAALAQTLAQAVICTGEAKPCGCCAGCIKAAADSHPDILRYCVPDKARAFKIDIVREIRNLSYILPNEADKKVFILENAHTMGIEGQNAFLKILEEPPKYVQFLLLCKTKANFLPTVLSRATVYYLGEAVNEGEGDVEKAVEAACNVARACVSADELDIVTACSVFEKDKDLLRLALPELEEIFACALRTKYAAEYDDAYGDVPALLAGKLTSSKLLRLTEQVRMLAGTVDMNANHNLLITRLCTLFRRAVS